MATAYKYGNDVTYSSGTYTLTNTMTSTGTWSNDYNTLSNNHYTCFSASSTCSSVYYIYYTDTYGLNYIILTNGKKIDDALEEMLNIENLNINNSGAKTVIDNWYSTNLSIYSRYIEDTIYCNDRSTSSIGGWNPNGGDTTKYLYFSSYTRMSNSIPSLTCNRVQDQFTVSGSIGNGNLTYPIGLITSDEVMYAGANNYTANRTYYLYNNKTYWTNSHSFLGGSNVSSTSVRSDGSFYVGNNYLYLNEGIRPVISLKSTDIVESGDGTQTNPYVIKTS
jgi:hypothetical protein